MGVLLWIPLGVGGYFLGRAYYSTYILVYRTVRESHEVVGMCICANHDPTLLHLPSTSNIVTCLTPPQAGQWNGHPFRLMPAQC